MKVVFSRTFVFLFVVLLSFSTLAIFNVKAQQVSTLKINLIFPSNTTYNQNSILLNFSSQTQPQDNLEYTISYKIEGENANYQGTFSLRIPSSPQIIFHSKMITEIPDGTYTLIASAKYVDRIMWVYADRQTVTFTINTKTPTPSPTPEYTLIVEPEPVFTPTNMIATISIITIVGLGILAYYKKRRS